MCFSFTHKYTLTFSYSHKISGVTALYVCSSY